MKVSKTLELRKVIKTELEKVAERVYYESASEKALFPYIVYELNSSIKNYSRDDITLTIDVWDRNTSTKVVEQLADDIEQLFHSETLSNGKVYPTIYLEVRNSVKDEDKTLKRRQLRFTIQNYEGGI